MPSPLFFMNYALFFDIDGTLVSFKTHEIPASTILALTQAKADGHKVFIATGRPPIIITNLGAIEHLIDGYVTTNGALCFVGDQIVSCHAIPPEAARLVAQDAQEKHYSLIAIGERDVAVYDPKGDVDRIFRQQLAVENLHLAKSLDDVLQQRILQLTPFFPADYEAELMARIPSCISGRWHPEFTDITAKNADKGNGLLTMAAYAGLDVSHTIAFGDGGNDTSMIRTAGIGVAMGNAIDALKQEADYVTTSVDEHGILNALKHFGLLCCLMMVMILSGCSSHHYTMETGDTGKWYFPLPGAKVISDYGHRNGRQHTGIDLKTKDKDKIYAAFDGEVVWSKPSSGYGNLVRIKHANGLETYYAHNTKNLVKQGEKVKAGQAIALTGQTGRASTPHLHFETRVEGKPRNPSIYFDFARQQLRQEAFRSTKKGFVIK